MQTIDEILTAQGQIEETIETYRDASTQVWRDFSKALATKLSQHSCSHAKFAKQIGIHESYLSRILSGEKHWSFKLARKAITALGSPTP